MSIIRKTLIMAGLACTLSACVSTIPREVTANNGPTNLVGESSCTQFLLFNFGDCSYEAAKRNAGITNVHHTDTQISNYLIFSKTKTLVYGTK
jgi:TRL-like protein family